MAKYSLGTRDFRGLRLYLAVYPDSSHSQLPLLVNIFFYLGLLSRENTLGLEGSIVTVVFISQYSIVCLVMRMQCGISTGSGEWAWRTPSAPGSWSS